MSKSFKNRVFGISVIKAINSNFNADFTRQPRTLPDGIVYATDKAYKYMIRKYILDQFNQKLLLWKRFNENLNPLSIEETYEYLFKKKLQDEDDKDILKNLFTCFDVRIFGATFTAKNKNFSIHGALQISHSMNRYPENEIYFEQILSPLRNTGKEGSEEKKKSSIGNQYRLREGHYVYHFSLNPSNYDSYRNIIKDLNEITEDDIKILKEAMRKGVSYFDSTSKAGSDNELFMWIQLNEGSKKVLPNFVEYVQISKENGKINISLKEVLEVIKQNKEEIQKIELYYDEQKVNVPEIDQYANELKIEKLSLFS